MLSGLQMKLLATYLWLQLLFIKFQTFPPFPFSVCEMDLENWRGKKELVEREERQECHTPQACLLH